MVSLKSLSLSLVFCYFLLGSLPPDRHRPAGSRQTNSPKLNPKAVDHGQVHSMSHTSSMPVMSCRWGVGGVPQQSIFQGKVGFWGLPAQEICINHDGTLGNLGPILLPSFAKLQVGWPSPEIRECKPQATAWSATTSTSRKKMLIPAPGMC